MDKNVFFKELIRAIEIREEFINEDTKLYLDSLSTLLLITFIDERFNKQIDTSDLTNDLSVRSLMELIGIENFENI